MIFSQIEPATEESIVFDVLDLVVAAIGCSGTGRCLGTMMIDVHSGVIRILPMAPEGI